MSGGSMNYVYAQVREVADHFSNPQIRELIEDVSDLLHDKEWADSGDYSDGTYNKTEKDFIEKWFLNHDKTLKAIISNEIESVRDRLLNCIGSARYCKDCVHWKQESSSYGICKDDKWSTHGYEYGCKDWSNEVNRAEAMGRNE